MPSAFVHFVESPRPDDLLDGRTEGKVLVESLGLAGVPVEYSLAVSYDTFRICLDQRLVAAWQKHQRPPILHLSCHGNPDGIQLTDGRFILWQDLRPLLLPAFNAMNAGLLLCMSSCGGAFGMTMAMEDDAHKPFWQLVGPHDSVLWSDAAIGFTSFYHLFFKDLEVGECVRRMNQACGEEAFLNFDGRQLRESWTNTTSSAEAPAAGMTTLAQLANGRNRFLTLLQATEISFDRPMLNDEMRSPDRELPDPVRVLSNVVGVGPVMVIVSYESVQDYWGLRSYPTWRDFDNMWDVIQQSAERLIRSARFATYPDATTDYPQVMVLSDDVGRAAAA